MKTLQEQPDPEHRIKQWVKKAKLKLGEFHEDDHIPDLWLTNAHIEGLVESHHPKAIKWKEGTLHSLISVKLLRKVLLSFDRNNRESVDIYVTDGSHLLIEGDGIVYAIAPRVEDR